jgi:hypothetical protein
VNIVVNQDSMQGTIKDGMDLNALKNQHVSDCLGGSNTTP